MEMTAAASWLMSAFSGLDLGILSLLHTLSEHAGWLLTPLAKLVTLLGEKGILFFLLSLVLMCFAKTRPLGVCIFGAVCCGALITNILLKDWIARPRPFLGLPRLVAVDRLAGRGRFFLPLRPRHRRGGGHGRAVLHERETLDLALGGRGAGDDALAQLSDGPLPQ